MTDGLSPAEPASGIGRSSVFDLSFATACLLCLIPLMLLVILAILVDTGWPVFFSQTRLGQHGRHFRLYKFRKFHARTPAGGALTVCDDPRLTRVGWFLERSKLDELPQLWNVLKGDMAILGPRPETPHFEDCFALGYSRVLHYKPGILGPAQAMFRNESALYSKDQDPEILYRNVLFPAKARIDLAYYPQRTVLGDMRWILLAILAVLGWFHLPQIGSSTVGELEEWMRQHARTSGHGEGIGLFDRSS